jgi:methylmalonyl-CoA mutase N-terminal domain/subunit
MEEKAMEYIRRIDDMGGMVAAIKRGYPQREIADAAFHYQRQVDAGEKRIVGINAYRVEEEPSIPLLKIDANVEKKQVARTREVRRKRNRKRAVACLAALSEASIDPKANLMPLLVDAAREYVTLGEMCDTLRETMGVYTDPAMF